MPVLSMHGSTAFYTLNLINSYRYTQTNLTNTFYNNVHDMYSCFHLNCTNNSDCAQSHHIHWSADYLCHNGHQSFNNENVISVISCCGTDCFNFPCHAISVHSRDVSALVSIHWMAILAPFAIFLVLLVIRIVSRMCKTCFQKTCIS